MQPRVPEKYHHDNQTIRRNKASEYLLQAILWGIWTLAVGATGYLSWHADVVARRAFNVVGLAIHCGLVGIIGMIVITLVEMRLRPWWFLERDS
jgi:hypothetical protein